MIKMTSMLMLTLLTCGIWLMAEAANIGFDATSRSTVDLAQKWTMVQINGFPANGLLTGFVVFNKYTTSDRPFTIGLYRPVSGCTYTLLRSWTPTISTTGSAVTITLNAADQAVFKAGDTLGFTWTNYGNIPFDYVTPFNYCEDSVSAPAVGSSVSLTAGRYGGRAYSLQAIYTTQIVQTNIGFDTSLRSTVDLAQVWTMVQIQGFQTSGLLTGFSVYNKFTTSDRPVTAGLYRPTGTAYSYSVLKLWPLSITTTGNNVITLSPADQVAFKAGDTIGLTWSNFGNIPFDYTSNVWNYYENSVAPPTVGNSFTLTANRYGNRIYSFQALYTVPTQTTVGFDTISRSTVDLAQTWTMVLKQGFSSSGLLLGFNLYTTQSTSSRALKVGLYRPGSGTCSYTVIKLWSLNIATSNAVANVLFSPADQIAFNAGDTIGLTWTNYGNVPFDYTSGVWNYCENNIDAPAAGSSVALTANRYGNRIYSFQAIYSTQ